MNILMKAELHPTATNLWIKPINRSIYNMTVSVIICCFVPHIHVDSSIV